MTPADMIDLWKRMKSIFPGTSLDAEDDPENSSVPRLVSTIALLSIRRRSMKRGQRHVSRHSPRPTRSYEKLRVAQLPPPLESKNNVSDILYGVVQQLKDCDLLPAVAFQLDTYGAFAMFKTLLGRLESKQIAEFPSYRKDLPSLLVKRR